ncbi:MAG: hypothetical protein ABWJ98_08110 [Hydrogenothermaceae bacterium]
MDFVYGVDNIGLFFIGLITLVSAAVSVYSYSYVKHIKNEKLFCLFITYLFSL